MPLVLVLYSHTPHSASGWRKQVPHPHDGSSPIDHAADSSLETGSWWFLWEYSAYLAADGKGCLILLVQLRFRRKFKVRTESVISAERTSHRFAETTIIAFL
jgi:hypothetical protein